MQLKKRILITCSEFPPLPGGIGNHAYNLALELSKNAYDVHVLTDYRTPPHNRESEYVFDKAQPFSIHRTEFFRFKPLVYISRLLLLIQLVYRLKPTKVFVSGKFQLWMGGLLAALGNRTLYIPVVHGSELKAGNRWSRLLSKLSVNRFNTLIAVSNFTKTQTQKLTTKPITVINNGFGIPNHLKPRTNATANSLKLVTVGSVTRRKGQHNIVEAMPQLIQLFPSFEYHMIGLPSEIASIQKRASELQITNHLIFHGPLSDADKFKQIQDCHLFMMLSEHLPDGDFEGFGIAVLEANALGLPAIGSTNSGIADAIAPYKSGLLVNPHDTTAITQAIQTIAGNYEQYSRSAIQHANTFRWEQVIKQYLKLLHESN